MTRILHLITRFIGGGAESVTKNQIRGLVNAEKQYDVHLGFGNEYDQDRINSIKQAGIEVCCFNQIRHYSLTRALPAVFQVKQYIEKNQIDIIHTHSTEAGIIGRWAGMCAGVPVIIHEIHGDPISQDRSFVLNTFIWLIERLSAPIATKLIVGSAQVRESFVNRGIGSKSQYELIYDGIDISEFEDAQPAQLPMSNGNPILLFIGRLEDGKGLFDLIEAFDRLESHDVDLLIAGDGPLESELEKKVTEQRLNDSIHLLGYRDDVPDLLAAADVLVLPSYREGTPRVISEALASKTPVVSTRVAGIPEQIAHGKCGLLIDPGDIDALTNALDRLLNSEQLREEMSQAGRSQVEQFSAKREQREIIQLYERLLCNSES